MCSARKEESYLQIKMLTKKQCFIITNKWKKYFIVHNSKTEVEKSFMFYHNGINLINDGHWHDTVNNDKSVNVKRISLSLVYVVLCTKSDHKEYLS